MVRKQDPGCPLVVAYGMGVDSTAMLVGMQQRGIRPDLILFADTGGEKPETYAYLPIIQRWLKQVGFPPVQVVRYELQGEGKYGRYSTLEEQMRLQQDLPGFAFGTKSCSTKWKRGPQDKFVAAWKPAQDCWARGGLVLKAIGYDAGPEDGSNRGDTKRAKNLKDPTIQYTAVDTSGKKHVGVAQTLEAAKAKVLEKGYRLVSTKKIPIRYRYWYPLRDWGWRRDECKRQIQAAGLPLPMKSSCFFCPAMKAAEVAWLTQHHPELAFRCTAMEEAFRAGPKYRPTGSTQGLWRSKRMSPFVHEQFQQLLPAYQLAKKKR